MLCSGDQQNTITVHVTLSPHCSSFDLTFECALDHRLPQATRLSLAQAESPSGDSRLFIKSPRGSKFRPLRPTITRITRISTQSYCALIGICGAMLPASFTSAVQLRLRIHLGLRIPLSLLAGITLSVAGATRKCGCARHWPLWWQRPALSLLLV